MTAAGEEAVLRHDRYTYVPTDQTQADTLTCVALCQTAACAWSHLPQTQLQQYSVPLPHSTVI